MPEKRGKILIIRGGAIGDFVLTLPAIAALRQTFPDTHLELVGYPRVTGLAHAAGLVDAFRSIEARPLARFFARNAELDKEWSAYFESFHLIISYLYDPDRIFQTNVARATKAHFIQAPHRPNETEDLHATAVFLKPLEQLAIFDADPIPKLAIPGGQHLPAGRWLAVHPGSGSEKKNWPEERWLELLRSLNRHPILLIGGEAEGDRLTRIQGALASNQVRLARNLALVDLAGLLAQCQHFIGHDSGITHLAAAVGVKVVSLWGPSRSEIWRPAGPQVTLVQAPGKDLENLPVSTVHSTVLDHIT